MQSLPNILKLAVGCMIKRYPLIPLYSFIYLFIFLTIALLLPNLPEGTCFCWSDLSLKWLLGQPCFQFDKSLSGKSQGHTEDVLTAWISRANKNEVLFKLNIILNNEGKVLWILKCLQIHRCEFPTDSVFILFIFLSLAVCLLALTERLSTLPLELHKGMETWDWIPADTRGV